ncbi:MAG TPA: MBL fold metallo-hydrolase [Treponema sp.]|nr:MBL fold metallo-hydrolase [Treponema sp.]
MPVTINENIAAGVEITILADNIAEPPLTGEHGFSAVLAIRKADDSVLHVLFDTGRGVLFHNAPLVGVDLSKLDALVLSHGHYDHTDALPEFVKHYPHVRIHASTGIFRDHYSKSTGESRFIGFSAESRVAILAPDSCYVPFTGKTAFGGGLVSIADNIPRSHPLELTSPLLFDDKACTIPDTVPDELVLWIDTVDGLVIVTGCCHAGFINTVEFVRSQTKNRPIALVCGGLHLAKVSTQRIEATARYIVDTKIARVAAFHCTGVEETRQLVKLTGGIVEAGQCGTRLQTGRKTNKTESSI